jgi:3,4-dihydroxy-2-butanone 4-phosphate synthase
MSTVELKPGPSEAVARAVHDLATGGMVVVRNDFDRGAEGDLLVAAEFADAEAINFMATHARGLIWVALSAERCDELGLKPMKRRGRSSLSGTPMVSIEARHGVSTGISAGDRARTVEVCVDPAATPEDLVHPGHVFPLRAEPGGVVERPGRTEAAVDLARTAGLQPAGVLCEIIREDGHAARGEEIERFAAEHGLPIVSASEVAALLVAAEPARIAPAVAAKHEMRTAMGHFATGVAVVTATREGGAPVGTTVNAFSSVSLEPPLLLVCLANDSETLAAVRESGRFAVNLLAADQRHHSNRFASKGDDARPHEVEWERHHHGVPILPGALATVACEVDAIHPAGDHVVVIAEALSLAVSERTADPLLFYRGSYSNLQLEDEIRAA